MIERKWCEQCRWRTTHDNHGCVDCQLEETFYRDTELEDSGQVPLFDLPTEDI
jgi:hypothetical protein